jgi:hypothetical protein
VTQQRPRPKERGRRWMVSKLWKGSRSTNGGFGFGVWWNDWEPKLRVFTICFGPFTWYYHRSKTERQEVEG